MNHPILKNRLSRLSSAAFGQNTRNLWLLLVIIIEGYVVLASEIIAIRLLVSFVGSDTPIVAIIISSVLLPMAFGYYRGGQLYHRMNRKNLSVNIRETLIQNAIIASGFLAFGLSLIVLELFFTKLDELGIESRIAQATLYSLLFLAVPTYLLAQTTPLISNYFKKQHLSQAAGHMLFSSTVGSFLGAILTSLLLMHLIGVHNTVIVTMLALWFLVIVLNRYNLSYPTLAISTTTLIAIALNNDYTMSQHGIASNNQYSTIEIIDVEGEQDYDSRIMRINNSNSSKYTTNIDKQFMYVKYIEKFVIDKLPTTKINEILVIGAGGFSIGANDNRNNYTYIDIDASLLEISEQHLLKKPLGDTKKFIPLPARVFLKKDPHFYDLIVLDAYSHTMSIPQQLVTKEYFEDVKSKLNEDGVMVANIIAKHNFSDAWSIKIDNTIRSVFHTTSRIPLRRWSPWDDKDANVIYIGYKPPIATSAIYTDNKNSHFLDR